MAAHLSRTLIARGDPGSLAVVAPLAVVAAVFAAAVFWPELVVEVSRGDFALVTVLLGGGAAWLSGRAIAGTWRPYRQTLVYAVLLGCIVRFFHFALFEGTLLSLPHFLTDTAFLIAVSTLGFRSQRSEQMSARYGWLFAKAGQFGWRAHAGKDDTKSTAQ